MSLRFLFLSAFLLSFIVNGYSADDTEHSRKSFSSLSSRSDFFERGTVQDKEIILQLAEVLSFDLLNDEKKWARKQASVPLYSLLSGGRSLKTEGYLTFQDLRGKLSSLKTAPADNLSSTLSLNDRLEMANILLDALVKAEQKGRQTYMTSTVNLLTLAFADSSDEKVFDFFLNAHKRIGNDKACRTLKKILKTYVRKS